MHTKAKCTKENNEQKSPDSINSELTKYGGRFLHRQLLQLFINCWTNLDEWRLAKVVSKKVNDLK